MKDTCKGLDHTEKKDGKLGEQLGPVYPCTTLYYSQCTHKQAYCE